jgi:hypothetical protein
VVNEIVGPFMAPQQFINFLWIRVKAEKKHKKTGGTG